MSNVIWIYRIQVFWLSHDEQSTMVIVHMRVGSVGMHVE